MANASIYGNIQGYDLAGSLGKGMRIREMMDQRSARQAEAQKMQQLDQAANQNLVGTAYEGTGVKGAQTFNQMTKNQNDLEAQKLDMAVKNAQFGAQVLGPSENQEQWTAARNQIAEMGMPVQNIPEIFSPETRDTLVAQAQTIGQRLQQQNADRNYGLQKDQFDYSKKKDQRDFGLREKEMDAKLEAARIKAKGDAGQLATDLRKEWSSNDVTKATQEVSAAYNKVQNAAKEPTAAGDLSMIFNYMKMLDPGSVVREGEFANAQNAAGVPDRIRNMYNRVKEGTRLAEDQRKDFVKQAEGVYSAQLDQQKKWDADFTRLAQKAGIDPKDVVLNIQANQPQTKKEKEPGGEFKPLSADEIQGMNYNQKYAEAVRRGLVKPDDNYAGAMSRPGDEI